MSNEERQVQDASGNWGTLQICIGEHRPEGAAPDCAYCVKKFSCSSRLKFLVGRKYPPCQFYKEVNEVEKEKARSEELKKITTPIVKPLEAAPDCAYCKQLGFGLATLCFGGWGSRQGMGQVCENYMEIKSRPPNEPKHCLFCLINYKCTRRRVLHEGTPCERYQEIVSEAVDQQAG
jgi:hypothetical protein